MRLDLVRIRLARTHGLAGRGRDGTSALHASRLVGPHRQLDPVPHGELADEAREVGLHRAHADVQLVGDLGVGAAAGDGQEHVLLTNVVMTTTANGSATDGPASWRVASMPSSPGMRMADLLRTRLPDAQPHLLRVAGVPRWRLLHRGARADRRAHRRPARGAPPRPAVVPD